MQKLLHYNILEPLGTGSSGALFRGRDTVHGRTVLIRVMPPSISGDPSARASFVEDAKAAAALSHPNIAALFEVGSDGPHLFLATEFIPGQSLRKVIAGRALGVRAAIDIAVQLADALAEAHGHGMVHGDLRPENVRVNPKGQSKILDFGLAHWIEAGVRDAIPSDADPYLSPERAGGGLARYAPRNETFALTVEESHSGLVDAQADLFALGALLFEMLTGRPAVARRPAGHDRPLAPSALNPEAPAELDAIVLRALADRPDDRYQAAASLAAELRSVAAILDIRTGDREPPIARQLATSGRRPPVPRRLIATVLLLVLLAVGWWRAGDAIGRLWQRYTGPAPAPIVMVTRLDVDDPRWQHWGDGLAEDLARRLGAIPGLSVVSRSAAREPLPLDLDGGLQPGAVLKGRVRVQGGRATLDLELLDALDGTPLWTSDIVTDVAEILAAETEIAETVARRLALTLEPSAARARKKSERVSEGAFDRYLRGREAMAEGRSDRAVELFEQAIREGDGFADLYAALALALHSAIVEGATGGATADGARRADRLREVARLAAAADPDLPQAALAQAMAAESLPDALGHVRRALKLDPSLVEAYVFAAHAVADLEPERADDLLRRAAAFDPSRSSVTVAPRRPSWARGLDAAGTAELRTSIARDVDLLLLQPLP